MKRFLQICLLSVMGLVVLAGTVPQPTSAASATTKEAQLILTKFGMPVGAVDGVWGSQTARGLCAFRIVVGATASRNGISSSTMTTLRNYNKKYSKLQSIPAATRSGKTTYMYANQTCQAMLYVKGGKYQKAIAISTGKGTTKDDTTPNDTYTMGNTSRGWYCSGQYPESCKKQTTGRFVTISNFGNMYNRRHVVNGVYVHGSTSVPTYPASAGCIRVSTKDSDWMYDNVNSMPIIVAGKY
jgi:lipoprotein-anchoring transpeptidase ErfK/SrfK